MSRNLYLIILDKDEESSMHNSSFLTDFFFSFPYDDLFSNEEKKEIYPLNEESGENQRNPKKFKDIFLKMKDYWEKEEPEMIKEYKKDISEILDLCDKAIKENQNIDFIFY